MIPWDEHRATVTPAEYERVVGELLAAVGRDLPAFQVQNQELIDTPEGGYRIDVTARFSALGAAFLVLIECKDHARRVERADVQVLADRLRATGAQKGMLFSTNGFQKGALEFARAHHIALIRLLEGELTYETRSYRAPDAPRPKPPSWADIPPFVGYLNSLDQDERWCESMVEPHRTEPLIEFLVGSV